MKPCQLRLHKWCQSAWVRRVFCWCNKSKLESAVWWAMHTTNAIQTKCVPSLSIRLVSSTYLTMYIQNPSCLVHTLTVSESSFLTWRPSQGVHGAPSFARFASLGCVCEWIPFFSRKEFYGLQDMKFFLRSGHGVARYFKLDEPNK